MDDPILRRIAMILPLLGSSNSSEVIHAATALTRLLRENGYSYSDLAARLLAPPAPSLPPIPPQSIPPREPPRAIATTIPVQPRPALDTPRRVKSAWAVDRDDIQSVYIRRGELDSWSQEFLVSINDQVQNGRSLTEKQRSKLNEILDRLGA